MRPAVPRRRRALFQRLRDDASGVALIEFAFSMPLVLAIGCYGIELSNLAWANMQVSQVALTLADNASRVGNSQGLTVQQLREVDINDIFQGARLQGASLKLTQYGRITLSSLENVQQTFDSTPVQRIHWQRCVGLKGTGAGDGYDSSYGSTDTSDGTSNNSADAGTAAATGMGDTGSKVTAPSGFGVMFVEVNYDYQPLFGTMLLSPTKLHYVASFIVRDRRDFTQLYNPAPTATASTCNLHTA